MWRNPGETGDGRESNGVDDDGNGYVDDWRGWDWANDDNNPQDDMNHGTHVAGTIGALGNNGQGIAGVNWNVKIMALKFLDSHGDGDLADAVEALRYATAMGVRITNSSWGGGPFSQAMFDALKAADAQGALFVAAAGNSGADNDAAPVYPASYDVPNVIAVAATDQDDVLASFSNRGRASVDLAAPGTQVYSTVLGGGYDWGTGTSMSAPHVSGTAALAAAAFPGATGAGLEGAAAANRRSEGLACGRHDHRGPAQCGTRADLRGIAEGVARVPEARLHGRAERLGSGDRPRDELRDSRRRERDRECRRRSDLADGARRRPVHRHVHADCRRPGDAHGDRLDRSAHRLAVSVGHGRRRLSRRRGAVFVGGCDGGRHPADARRRRPGDRRAALQLPLLRAAVHQPHRLLQRLPRLRPQPRHRLDQHPTPQHRRPQRRRRRLLGRPQPRPNGGGVWYRNLGTAPNRKLVDQLGRRPPRRHRRPDQLPSHSRRGKQRHPARLPGHPARKPGPRPRRLRHHRHRITRRHPRQPIPPQPTPPRPLPGHHQPPLHEPAAGAAGHAGAGSPRRPDRDRRRAARLARLDREQRARPGRLPPLQAGSGRKLGPARDHDHRRLHADRPPRRASLASYRVTAFDRATPANESAPSASASATPLPDLTPPAAPTGLQATAGDRQVALDWADNTDPIAGYRVYRNGSPIASPTSSAYTDTGLTNGTSYTYRVTALDPAGNESGLSNQVSATPTSTRSPRPTRRATGCCRNRLPGWMRRPAGRS